MAPKKSKKKGKIGDDWDDDPEADVDLNKEPSVEPPAAVDKKAPKKKGKGKKGKPKFGDWDSDDDAAVPSIDVENDGPESAPAKEERKPFSRSGSSGFAMLQDDLEEESDDEPAGPTKKGASAFGVLMGDAASDDEAAESDDSKQTAEKESKLKVGRIISVEKHPKADKLLICRVDVGSSTLQVVTNAKKASKGKLVVVATVGCKTRSGITVDSTKVRGIQSSGMLCSAYDVGWVEAPDEVLLELPDSFSPGDSCPAAPPLEGILLDSAADQSMDDPPSSSSATSTVHGAGRTSVDSMEVADSNGSSAPSSSKKKKGTGGKARPSFAMLADTEEDVAEENGEADDASEEELHLPPKRKKEKKKAKKEVLDLADEEDDTSGKVRQVGKKPDFENIFAQLDKEETHEENGVVAHDVADDELQLPPKRKKDKKKALKGADLQSAFEQLEGSIPKTFHSNGDVAGAVNGMEEVLLPDKQLKEVNGAALESLGEDAPDVAESATSRSKGKAKKLSATSAPEPIGDSADEDLAELTAGKKKKKGKKLKDVDSLFAALEADAAVGPTSDASELADASQQADKKPEPVEAKGKKKKKGAKASGKEEDLDAILAELGMAPPSASQPETTAVEGAQPQEGTTAADTGAAEVLGQEAKGKKKKKGAKASSKEEDLDAILAELGMAPPSASQPETTAVEDAQAQEGSSAADAEAAELVVQDDADADSKELTAAQKKKLKKKAKEKEKKKAAQEGEVDDAEEVVVDSKKGKKGGKQSAAVKRLQEALEKERVAAEARRLAEEERRRQEEEAERLREEEERRKAEEAERKKAEKKERRAEMKRQGLLLTGKAKKEAERLAAMREQFLKQTGAELVDGAEPPAKKKVVYDTRKKKPPPKKISEESTTSVQTEEVALEAVSLETALDVAGEAEVGTPAAEAPEPSGTAAPEPMVAQEEEESDDDDWEAMDLDDLRLPGQKAADKKQEEEIAPVPVVSTPPAVEEPTPAVQAESEESSDDEDSEDEDEDDDSTEESSSEEESSSYETDSEDEAEERLRIAKEKREARLKAALDAGSRDNLRSPICCILGHVDTGKTKLLDNIRRTNVQEGEAGGITQQIGATYVPMDAIQRRTDSLRKGKEFDMKLPGLLIIDTPGHESFSNLRSRGSGLCDIAILVVDLMHGLEPQTIESINLLKLRKTPFIVALNKVDRLFDWAPSKDAPIQESLAQQKDYVQAEFEKRLAASILALNEQGLNVALYWKNPDVRRFVNIVPTSAITGEGIPDMLQLLVKLTQSMMAERLMFISELQCTVLEVKVVEGHGTTIDVVLVNGVLHEGDTIVICGLQGPIVTSIRSLLTPHPLKELRVRGQYDHHKSVKAAQGIKIAAHGLENAVAGTQLLVVGPDDDVDALKAEVMEDMQDIFSSVDRSGEGVCVQASTLGSLEALLEFLKSPAVKIPVSSINIGPIHKKDVMRASVMLEKGRRKFCCILAFDVPVTREAAELAEKLGVRIFSADIIYHLFDQFSGYIKQVKEEEQEAAKAEVAFPCELAILPNCIYNTKDPIVLGVEVKEGIAKVGTPICVPSQGGLDLGKISGLELNHKPVDKAVKGDMVAVKIEATKPEESSRLYGRHFDHKDVLVSRMSRKSIDLLKLHFKDELTRDDWKLVVKLKKVFNIE